MPKRRILTNIDRDGGAQFMLFQRLPEEAEKYKTNEELGFRNEVKVILILVFATILSAVLAASGHIPAQIVGMIAFSLLVLSTLLIYGNYLIATRRMPRNSQIYFWVFSISTALIIFDLVQKGVLPLIFGGILGQSVGIMQFETLVSWVTYLIIAVCVIGIVLVTLFSPRGSATH